MPLEQSFPVRVQPAEAQDGDEAEHREEAVHAQFADGENPGKHEHRECVEDQEQEGDDVKAHRELHPGFAYGLRPAFVVLGLGGGAARWTDQPRGDEGAYREGEDEGKKDNYGYIAGQLEHLRLIETARRIARRFLASP